VEWIHSEKINNKNIRAIMSDCDGVIVAPGFGDRGVEGKILAVKYARENKIPFFGICLGMQVAVIEFFRNVCGYKTSHSSEMNSKTKYPVIDLMDHQISITKKGGTMRLGSYKCQLVKDTLAYKSYQLSYVMERHRHRYEFNNKYREELISKGMIISGYNEQLGLVEIIEIKDHPWFMGVQFHPEYQSSFINPHPLFVSFLKTTLLNK